MSASKAFTPSVDRDAGQRCHGVHVAVRDRERFEPVRTGLAIARAMRRLYPRDWDFAKLERLVGEPRIMNAIDAGLPPTAITDTYRTELAAFANQREKYLLYGRASASSDR